MTEEALDEALRVSLAARGLTEAPPGVTPDFVVRHQLTTQHGLSVEPIGFGLNATGTQDVSGYTEGTLIIDFIDAKTRQIFWHATANDVVNRPASPDRRYLGQIVGRIVSTYPFR
jgi:Domain of unknown function (DUF4136)